MKTYHLVYEHENWTLKQEGQPRPVAIYKFLPKGDAIHEAVTRLKQEEAVLTIFNRDGVAVEERTFQSVPEFADRGRAIPMPDILAMGG